MTVILFLWQWRQMYGSLLRNEPQSFTLHISPDRPSTLCSVHDTVLKYARLPARPRRGVERGRRGGRGGSGAERRRQGQRWRGHAPDTRRVLTGKKCSSTSDRSQKSTPHNPTTVTR